MTKLKLAKKMLISINKKLSNENSVVAIYWSQINAERESDPEYYLLVCQQQY